MANFSVSKVNQFYVANKLVQFNGDSKPHLDLSDGVGAIMLIPNEKYNDLVFEYVSPGGIIRSDRIAWDKITNISATSACKCRRGLITRTIELKDLNGSATGNVTINGSSAYIVPGEAYILGLEFVRYIGISDQDKYYVNAAVQGTEGMTASEFYVRMAFSIARNLSREPAALIDIFVENNSKLEKIEVSSAKLTEKALYDAISAYTKVTRIVLKERILDNYEQGIGEKMPVDFVLSFDEITYNSVDVKWGFSNDITPAADDVTYETMFDGTNFDKAVGIGNGRKTADMEYFYMGERGDQERHAGWPNNVRTKYLVNPDAEYDHLVINFYWAPNDNDSGVRSTKVCNIVSPHIAYSDEGESVVSELAKIFEDFERVSGYHFHFIKIGDFSEARPS